MYFHKISPEHAKYNNLIKDQLHVKENDIS